MSCVTRENTVGNQRPHKRKKPAEQYRLPSPHHTSAVRQHVQGRGKVKPRHYGDIGQEQEGYRFSLAADILLVLSHTVCVKVDLKPLCQLNQLESTRVTVLTQIQHVLINPHFLDQYRTEFHHPPLPAVRSLFSHFYK